MSMPAYVESNLPVASTIFAYRFSKCSVSIPWLERGIAEGRNKSSGSAPAITWLAWFPMKLKVPWDRATRWKMELIVYDGEEAVP